MKLEPLANDIIKQYTEHNMTTVQIAEKYGCSDSGVGKLLARYGISRHHTPNELSLTPEQIHDICNKYLKGMTTMEIGVDFGLCDNTVAKILRQNGVAVRKAVRRSIIQRHDYFQVIDSNDKAYFLGWMISDGSVVQPQSRPTRAPAIGLEVKSDDRYIIEKFAMVLGADESIVHDFTKRGHSYIRFSSKEMADDLSMYGVVPNKSWVARLPSLDEKYMPHLIRGIFDGDGTVTIDKYGCAHFAFFGSKDVCAGIRDYLHDTIGLGANKVSKSTCYHVWWGGKAPAKLFADYLYNSCGEYYLKRKRDKFYT